MLLDSQLRAYMFSEAQGDCCTRFIIAARWGRTQESVSECPWLNGAYASAFVRGFQVVQAMASTLSRLLRAASISTHVRTAGPSSRPPACLGGLGESALWMLADSLEDPMVSRHNFNAVVSQRDLHETFLPAFQTCVAAAPEQIMCSYNAVNGVPTCLDDKAQNGFLRKGLGYKGLIFPTATQLAMHSPPITTLPLQLRRPLKESKRDATRTAGPHTSRQTWHGSASGNLTIDDVDVALGRIATMRFNLGMFDQAASIPYTKIGNDVLNNMVRPRLAAALSPSSSCKTGSPASVEPAALKGKTIAIIGPMANDSAVLMG